MSILYGGKHGAFTVPAPITHPGFPKGARPISIRSADLNGDGKPDLVVADGGFRVSPRGVDFISVFMNDGKGAFLPAANYATPAGPHDVELADLNADGKIDVVSVNTAAGSVTAFLNTGHGGLLNSGTFTTGGGSDAAVLGSFNRDKLLDIAVANFDANTVSVLLGQ